MELTIAGIVAGVTYVMGQISKKMKWVDKKYIPYQTIVIGLVSGLIVWVVDLDTNLLSAIITCLFGSLTASGLYDVGEVKRKVDEEGDW